MSIARDHLYFIHLNTICLSTFFVYIFEMKSREHSLLSKVRYLNNTRNYSWSYNVELILIFTLTISLCGKKKNLFGKISNILKEENNCAFKRKIIFHDYILFCLSILLISMLIEFIRCFIFFRSKPRFIQFYMYIFYMY